MQIVIDIDENDYKNLMLYKEYPIGRNWLEQKVIAGTPLSKGHGRLIDVDYLREDFKASKKISFVERMDISCIVDHAPTIIEADREI